MNGNDMFLFQLILGTVPKQENSTSSSIVSEDNIKFLFELQKKVCILLNNTAIKNLDDHVGLNMLLRSMLSVPIILA